MVDVWTPDEGVVEAMVRCAGECWAEREMREQVVIGSDRCDVGWGYAKRGLAGGW